MTFDNDKAVFLNKKDKSRQAGVDKGIKKLVDAVNAREDYYTTSSCSGRIVLITRPASGKKNASKWLLKSHTRVSFKEVQDKLGNLPKDEVWLMQEPPILHVCCRTVYDAQILIDISRKSGFKRPAIISTGKKNVVEVITTERVDVPVAFDKKILVESNHLKFLVNVCNDKLKTGMEKIRKLQSNISKK